MPIVRMVMNMRTKCPHGCCNFAYGKQVKLLGWHLRLVETSRTNRSDYSFTPIGIIRTPCRNYPDRSLRLSRRPTDASAAMRKLLERLHRDYPKAVIVGHHDLDPMKDCPCIANVAREYADLQPK